MKAWLKCEIRPGMFSDERVAKVTVLDGSTMAYFVDQREVLGDRVRVDLFERNGVKWVTLPTDHPYQPIPARNEDVEPIEAGVVSA